MARKPETAAEPETTGHAWDGIEELNNPLPRWWLWTFYATIAWALVYCLLFPAWPLVSAATPGLLGYATRTEVAAEIRAAREANSALDARLAGADLAALTADATLRRYAEQSGAAVFRTNCAQCHGSGAAGAKGYPNLLDDDWLWGGTFDDLAFTIAHGVRNEQSAEARFSQMPAFGEQLSKDEIAAVVEHVLALSAQDHDAAKAETGAALFAENCAACHAEDGTGDRAQGAPNLADAIWLWGGDRATLTETVTRARFGVMPAWGLRLSEAQVKAVAAYVHQLGGGE